MKNKKQNRFLSSFAVSIPIAFVVIYGIHTYNQIKKEEMQLEYAKLEMNNSVSSYSNDAANSEDYLEPLPYVKKEISAIPDIKFDSLIVETNTNDIKSNDKIDNIATKNEIVSESEKIEEPVKLSAPKSVEKICFSWLTLQDGKCLCPKGQTFNIGKTACIPLPEHAHPVDSETDAWICNDGYREEGYKCVQARNCYDWLEFKNGKCLCPEGQTFNTEKTGCIPLPTNAHAVDSLTDAWLCDKGYIEIANRCAVDPNYKEPLESEIKEEVLGADVETKIPTHGVVINRGKCVEDWDKIKYDRDHPRNHFVRCEFQITFNNTTNTYSVDTGSTLISYYSPIKQKTVSGLPANFDGNTLHPVYQGLSGDKGFSVLWLEKHSGIGMADVEFMFWVRDGDEVVGKVVS